MTEGLTESQSIVLSEKLEAQDAVNLAQANVNSQLVVALNQQRLMLNAIVNTLKEHDILVDVPEFDEDEDED